MKTKLLSISAALALTINALAQIPTNGLVGYYPFTGNANDGSTNANNASVSGATLTADRFGNSNSAYSFNGTTDYIEIPHIGALNNQLYTISFWTKFSSASTPGSGGFNVNPALISKLSPSTSVTYNNWVFYEANGTPGFSYGTAGYGGSTSLYNNNIWHNIICAVNSDSVRFYYDGVLTSVVAKGPNLTFNSQPIRIGRSIATYWKAFSGIIDDIAIYNRALTPSEVTQIYAGCNFSVSTIANGATTFCQGNSVILSSSKQGSPFTFQWLINNSLSNGATNTNYTAVASGNYSVIVDSLGCIDTSNVITVTVNQLPNVSINTIPTFVNYYATPLLLSGNPTGGSFSVNGATATNFNPITAGLGTSQITYNYTNNNSCSNSASLSIIVYDTTGIVCTTYDTITSTIYDTLTSTIYDTLYTSVTDTLIINAVLTGVNPPNNTNTLKIYPNPASTFITIDNGNISLMAGYTLTVKNNLGQSVFTSLINQQQFDLNLSTWTGNGIYFVHIIDAQSNTIEIKKIVLQ